MTRTFTGKVALVTGAGSGIGAATAQVLAERGAQVTVFGRRKDKLDGVVADITTAGGDALAVVMSASPATWNGRWHRPWSVSGPCTSASTTRA